MSEYYLYRRTGMPRSKCKQCVKDANREYRKANIDTVRARDRARGSGWSRHPENRQRYEAPRRREKTRASYLKRTYGITLADFDAMAELQDNVCHICRQACRANEVLSVDHDHETGKVCGLLCFDCNSTLGRFNDDPQLVQRAADYLHKTRSPTWIHPILQHSRSNDEPTAPSSTSARSGSTSPPTS